MYDVGPINAKNREGNMEDKDKKEKVIGTVRDISRNFTLLESSQPILVRPSD